MGKPLYGLENHMIAYTPGGQIEVGAFPDRTGWSKGYSHRVGSCFLRQFNWETGQRDRRLQMFLDFHTCVVRDGISQADAHREFLKIRDYRQLISPDIEGAE